MRLVLLGPPGAGKGTLASRLSEKLSIPAISSGEIFRETAASATALGKKIQAIMAKGELVPDETTIKAVTDRLRREDAKGGFMLDGFPRTIAQAQALSDFISIEAALNLSVDEQEIIRRLSGRRICQSCGTIYHLESMPPKDETRCDRCGGILTVREDDKIPSIRKRLTVYKSQTEPLIRYYRESLLLQEISPWEGAAREFRLGQKVPGI
jgi:adenylate kinase